MYVCIVDWKKKMPNLGVENYVLLRGLTEDLSPGCSLSDSFEGLLWRGKGGYIGYIGFFGKNKKTNNNKKNQGVRTSKDYC